MSAELASWGFSAAAFFMGAIAGIVAVKRAEIVRKAERYRYITERLKQIPGDVAKAKRLHYSWKHYEGEARALRLEQMQLERDAKPIMPFAYDLSAALKAAGAK